MNFIRFSQGLRLGMSPEVADQMTKVYGGSKAPKTEAGGGPYSSESAAHTDTNSTNVSSAYQQSQYGQLLSGADSWLANGGSGSNYVNQNTNNAQMSWDQKNALTGVANSSNQTQQALNVYGQSALQSALAPYDPSKTGLNGAIDASNNRLNWDYNTQVAPQIRQGAIDTGQYGGSRSGIAEGIGLSSLSQQKVDASSQLAWQDQQAYNTNRNNTLQNLSAITAGLSSGANQAYNAGETTRSLEQQQIDKQNAYALEKWAYENNVPYNNLAAYKNLITGDMGGTVQGSGNTAQSQNVVGIAPKGASSSGGGGGSALGSIGMVGGAIVGGIYGGGLPGASLGASLGGGIGNSFG